MRILFICGSLEPGVDGVGDYTRRLAKSLILRNYDVLLVSLRDRDAMDYISEEQGNNIAIETIRIPKSRTQRERFNELQIILKEFNPDIISLQFGFVRNVKSLGYKNKWHIMFHELWLGTVKDVSFKHKLIGYVQKLLIIQLLKKIQPDCISVQSILYRQKLENLGFKPILFPLYGNIPVTKKKQNVKFEEGLFHFAIFGTIQQKNDFKIFIEWLKAREFNNSKFHFLGNNGALQKNWIAILEKENLEYENYGWLKADDISNILKNCNLGLSTTPYMLSDKSGSVAAMREHRLKVLCISTDRAVYDSFNKGLLPNDIIIWNEGLKELPNAKVDLETVSVDNITNLFLNCLTTRL